MKILALFINLLGIPALIFTGMYVLQVPIILLYASGGKVATWGLIVFGFCFVLLPILLIIAEIYGWQSFMKRNYASSIGAYKWVFLDILIMVFLGVAISAGWVKK